MILLDAVHSGSKPGTIHRLDAGSRPISKRFFHHSTHAFSVAEAIELARTLGELPPRLIVYAIEGGNFAAGTELSLRAESALAEAERRVREEIKGLALPKQHNP